MVIFSKLRKIDRLFYSFSGLHAFLMGLFPFFIPVYLLNHGYNLQEISLFIAITALAFCITLRGWEVIFHSTSVHLVIISSFGLEIILLSCFFITDRQLFLFSAAAINGIYSCLFWLTQRLLFLKTITADNSGRKFGNLQIFVFIMLKTGIFSGGLLLEYGRFEGIFLTGLLLNLAAISYFRRVKTSYQETRLFPKSYRPMTMGDIWRWHDERGSKFIFIIDGVFLYLESYFWGLSLFLMAGSNYQNLAILVIILAISFGLLFYFIKNKIDKLDRNRLYRLALFIYLLSWLLRALLSGHISGAILAMGLLAVSFATGFFRLVFNKRFFEYAGKNEPQRYIILKSYYSQLFIAITFGILSLLYKGGTDLNTLLQTSYGWAAIISILYLSWRGEKR